MVCVYMCVVEARNRLETSCEGGFRKTVCNWFLEVSNQFKSVYTQVSETGLLCKPISNWFKIVCVNRVIVSCFKVVCEVIKAFGLAFLLPCSLVHGMIAR